MIKKKKRLNRKERQQLVKKEVVSGIFSLGIAGINFAVQRKIFVSVIVFFISMIVLFFISKLMKDFKETDRIKKIEEVFPDFLQLVASNLRAGMTVDKAMLMSSRPEFAPLDKEIFQTGKDISTGKPIADALKSMSDRIGSENITKTLLIILSGMRAGGNLSVLLEETSSTMRQRVVVAKKSASQVTMYVIFIFLAVAIFAPGLFALSGILVGTMTDMMGGVSAETLPSNLPVSFSSISISIDFVYYFSLIFIIVMNFMASLTLGLVSKGSEKEGLRYLPVMLMLSLGIFFAVGKVLSGVMGNMMG